METRRCGRRLRRGLLATAGLLLSIEGTCLPNDYFAGLALSAGSSLAEAFTSSVTNTVLPSTLTQVDAGEEPQDGDGEQPADPDNQLPPVP